MLTLQQQILSTAYTVDMAHHQVAVLQEVLEQALYHAIGGANRPLEQRFTAALNAREDEAEKGALRSWGTDWLEGVTQESLQTELRSLRKWLQGVPTLLLYVPVTFDTATVAELSEWVRAEIGGSVLLDVKVDANMIGGCSFVHDAVYYDRSLHGRLRLAPDTVSEILDAYAT